MAKKAVRKTTSRKTASKRGVHNKIPAKHHDRVIVYGGILAIFLLLLVTQMM